ncbi:hypothetical protein SH139x_002463 [Planctomycetaceae bacterium SH139]
MILKTSLPLSRIGMVFLLAFLAGCAVVPMDIAAPKPLASHNGQKSQTEVGRGVYVSMLKCAMCHRPKPVYDYDPATWESDILPRMAKKARLKPAEYAAVLEYVTSAQAQTRPE